MTEENLAPVTEAKKEEAPKVDATPAAESKKEEASKMEAKTEKKLENTPEKKKFFFQCPTLFTIKFGMIT